MAKVEYKVRKIERFIVTRYTTDGRIGTSTQHGIFDSEPIALAVGYALCKAEHDISGEPIDSMNFIYPTALDDSVPAIEAAVS